MNEHKIRISELEKIAPMRGPGYMDDVRKAAIRTDSEFVWLSHADYLALGRKYRGAGDVVAAAAKPIADAVGLGNCGGCKKRQGWLNKLIPFRSS